MCRRMVCVEEWGVCKNRVCVLKEGVGVCEDGEGVCVCKNGVCVCIKMRYRSTCGTECVYSGQFRFSCAVSSI